MDDEEGIHFMQPAPDMQCMPENTSGTLSGLCKGKRTVVKTTTKKKPKKYTYRYRKVCTEINIFRLWSPSRPVYPRIFTMPLFLYLLMNYCNIQLVCLYHFNNNLKKQHELTSLINCLPLQYLWAFCLETNFTVLSEGYPQQGKLMVSFLTGQYSHQHGQWKPASKEDSDVNDDDPSCGDAVQCCVCCFPGTGASPQARC